MDHNDLTKLATLGDPIAQFNLGVYYHNNEEAKQAAYWWEISAQKGTRDAQFNLGLAYLLGNGVEQDSQEAAYWLRKAWKQGHDSATDPELQYSLARSFEDSSNFQQAYRCYEAAADNGHILAQTNLGRMLMRGDGAKTDYREAMEWFKLSAASGDNIAQHNLGLIYAKGLGVPVDYRQAIKWYSTAAKQGLPESSAALGDFFYANKNEWRDINEAIKWYQLAADQNHLDAQYQLASIYLSGEIPDLSAKQLASNKKKASRLLQNSSDQGHTMAQLKLADLYLEFYEEGGEKDKKLLKKALNLFRFAAEQGHPAAMFMLGSAHFIAPDIINKKEAYDWVVWSLKNPDNEKFERLPIKLYEKAQVARKVLEEDIAKDKEDSSEYNSDKNADVTGTSDSLIKENNSDEGADIAEFNYRRYTTEFDQISHPNELVDSEILRELRQKLDTYLADWKATNQREFEAQFREIYYRNLKNNGLDKCAFTLLVDNSGSMRGRPITVAAMSADILSSTLERCGVKTEILGFTTRSWKGGSAREKWVSEGKRKNPGRLNDLRHIIYKSADSPLRRARSQLGLMLREGLLKENIDGEALIWAHHRLIARPEQRRILMVISDGAPVDDATLSANPGNYLERHLRETIEFIETRSDVELLAIGIGHDVERFYKNATKAIDPEELGNVIMDKLVDLFKN